MFLSQVFKKASKDDESRPLSECYNWARAHSAQRNDQGEEFLTPMLVYVRQTGDSRPYTPILREYNAETLDSFMQSYSQHKNDSDRHCDEVIGLGPCKAYCDFELEFDDAKVKRFNYTSVPDMLQQLGFATIDVMRAALVESADRLIGQIVDYHKQVAGVDVVPFVTLAHKPFKWSKHVVFVNSVWRNATHLGTYMKRLLRAAKLEDPLVALYFDTQVYGRFRTMRMYRSSKLKEPKRSLLQADDRADTPIDPLDMVNSLITVIPLPPRPESDDATLADIAIDNEPIYVTSTYFDRYPEMLKLTGLRPIEDAEATSQEMMSGINIDDGVESEHSPVSPEFSALLRQHFEYLRLGKYKWREYDCVLYADCGDYHCPILGRAHDTPRTYFELDFQRQMWRRCCYSIHCRHRPTPWRAVESAIAVACIEFLKNWRCLQTFPEAIAMMGRPIGVNL